MYTLGSLGPAPSSVLTLLSQWALPLAILSLPPLRGPMAVILSPRMGGVASRWAALLLLALPLIGRLVMELLQEGIVAGETALALASSLNILATAGLVLWLGRELNWGDVELEQSRIGLARHRDWLAQVIDQLPEGILLVDGGGRLTIYNGTIRRLLPELDSRRTLKDVFGARPDELGHLIEPLERCFRENLQLVGLEATVLSPAGEKVPLLIGMAPLPDVDGGRGAVVVMQDVTRYKAYEQAREEWLAVVAHDLRQPISVISLAAQQLQRGTSEQARSLQLMERIHSLSADLARMVEDLLDASRIEAHRMELHPEPTELTSRLRDLVQALEDVTPHHTVELQLPNVPLWVQADVPRLRQILGNLLSNAEKYGEPDTPITVKLEPRAKDAVVSVSNSGDPLPQHELDRLFRRFVRADTPATASKQGVGLGLYITRGLVEAHGGRTWAASDGRWMRVCFSIPLIDPPGSQTPVEALH
jgi:signal transduction histidine kinase